MYFVEGRHDQNSTPVFAVDYLNEVTPRSKQLVWFEHPGHDEPAAFEDFMVSTVLAQTLNRG